MNCKECDLELDESIVNQRDRNYCCVCGPQSGENSTSQKEVVALVSQVGAISLVLNPGITKEMATRNVERLLKMKEPDIRNMAIFEPFPRKRKAQGNRSRPRRTLTDSIEKLKVRVLVEMKKV